MSKQLWILGGITILILVIVVFVVIFKVYIQKFTLFNTMRYKLTFHSQWGNNSIKAPQNIHSERLYFLVHDGSQYFFKIGQELKQTQGTSSANGFHLPGQMSIIVHMDKKNSNLSFITNLIGCDNKKVITGIPGSINVYDNNGWINSISIPMYLYGIDNGIVKMKKEGSIFRDQEQPIGYLEIQRI